MIPFLVFLGIATIVLAIALRSHGAREEHSRTVLTEAREAGLHEPVSIHPDVDPEQCIGCGACVDACPEKEVIGLVEGKMSLLNGSVCIGHGACVAACPTEALTLVFGTEARGVELPMIDRRFQTNVPGIFIAGELGGMGLIRNAVTQGREAIEYLAADLRQEVRKTSSDILDLIIVGAGPAGLSASLKAIEEKLNYLTVERETLGGTIAHYPRQKLVMTQVMNIPLYGPFRKGEARKEELMELWETLQERYKINLKTGVVVEAISREPLGLFQVKTTQGIFQTRKVLLCVGRRGIPRKLEVPGEDLPKVAYRLKDPELYRNSAILVVGGGDSALEAALTLSEQPGNRVALSYRGEAFARAKRKNRDGVLAAVAEDRIICYYRSQVTEIGSSEVALKEPSGPRFLKNDFVFILAGGESPSKFLENCGVAMQWKFGQA